MSIVAYLKELAVFCTAYMKHVREVRGRMVDRLRERAMSSHTDAEMFTTHSPRALPFREKTPDRSSAPGLGRIRWQIFILGLSSCTPPLTNWDQ